MTQHHLETALNSRYYEIDDATSFAQGDEFETGQDVRDYFTIQNIVDMFGETELSQSDLDAMADDVIENGWHMAGRDEE